MGLMRKAVAVLGFGDVGKSKKATTEELGDAAGDPRRPGTLSASQQDFEIPPEYQLGANSNDCCVSPTAETSLWDHRASADGRFGALMSASMRGISVTLDSPGGSTSSTPQGPTCTGGGHGEAPPSVGGAYPSQRLSALSSLSYLSGRQSASLIPIPSPLAGTATATPLARRVAKRALHKAGDSAPISLPSIGSLSGALKSSPEPSRGTGGFLQPADPRPLPTSPTGAACSSRRPGPVYRASHTGLSQLRRATTHEIAASGAGEDDANYLPVSPSGSAELPPGSPLSANRPAGTQPTSGRERFARWQSIPARPEHHRVAMVEDIADGQQALPHPIPHPPPFPQPNPFPPHRLSNQGISEFAGGPSRSPYHPSHLQPQQLGQEQYRRRISENTMWPQPPASETSAQPLPRLKAVATVSATAAMEASARVVEELTAEPAPLMVCPSPPSGTPPATSALAREAMAAAAAEAIELLPVRAGPLHVLSNPPSPQASPGWRTAAQDASSPSPFSVIIAQVTAEQAQPSGPAEVPEPAAPESQPPEPHTPEPEAEAPRGSDMGVAEPAAASPMSVSPVRPLSPVASAATAVEVEPVEAAATGPQAEPEAAGNVMASVTGSGLTSAQESSSATPATAEEGTTSAAVDAATAAAQEVPKAPASPSSFTARPVPQPGLLHFSPAAPSPMLRASIAWGVSDFKVVRKLYAGYASSVYKATCLYSGVDVVLKAYNLVGLSNFLRNQVLRELDIQSRLRHPGVVHLMAAFREGDLMVLVQEYVRGGSLDRVRRKLGGRMTEFQAMHLVLLPLLGVMNYLHGRGIVHRDIKPENLLFTESWQLKVCDYGVSICLHEERAVTRTGSREYMAPEVNVCPLKRGPEDNKDNADLSYTAAVDVWSLGALVYELLVGFTPFPGGPPPRKEGARGTAAGALAYPGGVSQGARAFVRSCLELDPADRPTVQQLLQHPWIVEALENDGSAQPPPAP